MIRNFLSAIVFFFLTIALSACVQTGDTVESGAGINSDKQTLRVGLTATSPPTAFKQGRKITGLEAEFALGLAQFAGKKLRFVELDWEDQIQALLDNKIDIIMSSMTITRGRQYQIAFSNHYMISGQVAVVRLAEMSRFSNGFSDLLNNTVKIGTVKGTTGDLLITKKISRGSALRVKTAADGAKALIDKRIDAFIYDLPMNFYLASVNEANGLAPVITLMTREQIAWGMRKEDTALLKTANDYLAAIKQDGRLKTMLIRWIPYFKNVFNK